MKRRKILLPPIEERHSYPVAAQNSEPLFQFPAVQLKGDFLPYSSLAHVNREWAKGLHQLGIATHIDKAENYPLPREYFSLFHKFPQHTPMGHFHSIDYFPAQKHPQAMHYILDMADTWRCGRVLSPWLYNQHSGTICLSHHCEDFLRDNGVNNTFVVPLGVDTSVFNPAVKPLDLQRIRNHPSYRKWGSTYEQPTTFLLTGFFNEKKGVKQALKAWAEFWHGGFQHCTLILKNTRDFWGESYAQHIEGNTFGASVEYSEAPLTDAEFAQLLKAVDVVISPSHLEGFGLIPLQAMAMGKPVVCTEGHGFDMYATSANASLIPTFPIESRPYPGFPFYSYNPIDGAKAFAHALATRDEPIRKMMQRATAEQFSWENSAKTLCKALEMAGGTKIRKRREDYQKGLVSLIVPCRSTKGRGLIDLQRLVKSFKEHEDYPHEIIIIDDGSEKPLPHLPGTKTYRGHGEGAATARNRALLMAQGEYILFLDADIETTSPQLEKLVERVKEDPSLVLHPKLLYPDGTIQSAGGEVFRTKHGLNTFHHYEGKPKDLPEAQEEREIDYGCTASLFMHRSWIEKAGYLYELDFTWWEDVFYCLFLRESGAKILYFPSVEMIHHAGSFTKNHLAPNQFTANSKIVERWFPNAGD